MYMLWRQSSSSDVSCSWPAARIFFQSGNNEYETGMSQLRPVHTQGLETSHLIHRFGCVTTCLSFSRHGSVSISPWQTTEASLAVFFWSAPVAFRRVALETPEWTSRDSNHHRQSVSAGKTNAIPTEPSGRLTEASLAGCLDQPVCHFGLAFTSRQESCIPKGCRGSSFETRGFITRITFTWHSFHPPEEGR